MSACKRRTRWAARVTRLRQGMNLRQSDVAARAGLARSTAALVKKGDPGRILARVSTSHRYAATRHCQAGSIDQLDQLLAEILAFQQPEKRFRRRVDAVRHGFARL